ncbi:L-carnitine dehydratase/bile acid-inducible protein F [Caballeronia glebae]|uniref:L-carnitine dehydratase/bile acid-inducible protein F n=1 Tax=Caballeronia glebae TaxID=1777143 RepID=A0A158AZ35_9BURK|nr:CoA transferase [Caballeronia glebae]SAK62993.1 L-carnitine dehydratase/bile acid-inducible protein F [Caballeronia glebae]
MTYPFISKLRVIESSAFIAAPLAGLTLAQYGADVIRIDNIGGGIDYGRMPRMPHPQGRGRSLYWTSLNKGKRSIAIDLRRPEGRELIQALVTAPGEDAGVLLTNIGTPWLSHELLEQRRHDVITCTIQGNGDGSTAVDYTVNCATGYPAVTGGGSVEHPVNHVLPAWDIACAYQAAFAVLAAVNHRRITGAGSELKLALADIAFSALSHLGVLSEAELLQQERPSIGNHLYGAFGRDFATKDSQRVMVVAISAGQWKALIRCCDIADAIASLQDKTGLDFSDEAQRFEARDKIAALIEPWFAERPFTEVKIALEENKVCWGQYQTVTELLANDPRASLTNPVFERAVTPGIGEHMSAGAAVRAPALPREPMKSAPYLGTHTDEVLSGLLGLDSGAIGRLHDARIVAGPEQDPTFA